jgi:aminodeoxyfutalosine deaminase
MQFITADRIHDGNGWLPEGTTIQLSDDGHVVAILNTSVETATRYRGVLAPGFVNVHCHLELSHMKGLVPEKTGLIPFLKQIPQYRNNFTEAQKTEARHAALDELYRNGIVAVGDIANTSDTIDLRSQDKIHFHTFVEALGFVAANAERSFHYSRAVFDAFAAQCKVGMQLRQSIVPHAPYSVSAPLFSLIDAHQPLAPLSIHNQESEEENKFYISGTGLIPDLLGSLGIDAGGFVPTGKRSLASYTQWLSPNRPYIFVHNTASVSEDIYAAAGLGDQVYWCFCPNANLYIEDRLPDIANFISKDARICIGTDSLASNHQLSILAELTTIKKHYPDIAWETLLNWGTHNGAKALGMDQMLGTIEPGKQPGILLLSGLLDSHEVPKVHRLI